MCVSKVVGLFVRSHFHFCCLCSFILRKTSVMDLSRRSLSWDEGTKVERMGRMIEKSIHGRRMVLREGGRERRRE